MRWAVALAWALSVGLVLPYSPYIKYIDLSVSHGMCSRFMMNDTVQPIYGSVVLSDSDEIGPLCVQF